MVLLFLRVLCVLYNVTPSPIPIFCKVPDPHVTEGLFVAFRDIQRGLNMLGV